MGRQLVRCDVTATRKQFWSDPYQTRLETRVAAVAGEEVTLEETIFFALSGGQESDRGTIGGHAVIAARWQDREILYTLPAGHGLQRGDAVTVAIDGERRRRLMRLHFAAEIVLELMVREHGPIEKVGAHIAEDKARIDFARDDSVAPILPALQAKAQAIVAADLPITSAFADAAAERRYWEIPGFARVPCGGTHLARTGEVGRIALKRRNPGKGKERIEVTVDPRP